MLKVLICLVDTKIIPIFVVLKEVNIQKNKAEYLTLDIQPYYQSYYYYYYSLLKYLLKIL